MRKAGEVAGFQSAQYFGRLKSRRQQGVAGDP
jgi:hypothetical protein